MVVVTNSSMTVFKKKKRRKRGREEKDEENKKFFFLVRLQTSFRCISFFVLSFNNEIIYRLVVPFKFISKFIYFFFFTLVINLSLWNLRERPRQMDASSKKLRLKLNHER